MGQAVPTGVVRQDVKKEVQFPYECSQESHVEWAGGKKYLACITHGSFGVEEQTF